MDLSKEIQDKISNLSSNQKQDEIVTYLQEQLQRNNANAQDVLDYARGCVFTTKPNTPYVIQADTINKFGVVVSTLDDKKQKMLALEFYKLAAERGSAWGNSNCEQC